MRLVIFSHKPCWFSAGTESGFATDGGFPFQMKAISELFDRTTVVVPCSKTLKHAGEIALEGHNLHIAPLTTPKGKGFARKLGLGAWFLRNLPVICRELWKADAVHTPIPGDIGTIGMVLALMFRKPLFVRHCGNWLKPVTKAEHFWKWSMEKFAGGKRVMLATGGNVEPPSARSKQVRWIFSTSLSEQELRSCSVARQAPQRAARLIIVCRQERQKGTGAVIESLRLIAKTFPGVSLDVVGDGASLKEFQDLAERLEVDDRVRFHGKVNHQAVVALLKQADLFCYPTSASEGFPKVVLEALACGLPVITTRVSVLPELISHGCGDVISKATPVALAESVNAILSEPERFRAMSAKAIETAAQYSLENWRDAIGKQLAAAWGALQTISSSANETPIDVTKLRICFLAGTLGRGGAERQLIFMLGALKQAGIKVNLLCLTNGEALEAEIRAMGIDITWVGASRWRPIRLLRIARELRRNPADIVQSAHFYTNLYAAVAGRMLGIKSIGAIRNDLISELRSNGVMGWGHLRFPHHLVANSRLGRGRAIEKGIFPTGIDYLPNAVSVNGMRQRTVADKNHEVRILFAARLTEQKRPDRFLRVLHSISAQRPDLPLKGVVAGDGPLRSQLEALADSLSLGPRRIEFMGELADLKPAFQQSDLLLLTSEWEGSPNVILEAMAQGVPVVATAVGGVPEIVSHGESGFVVNGDRNSMVNAVLSLVEDPELRKRMGRAGHKLASERFSSNRLAEKLTGIYQQVLA